MKVIHVARKPAAGTTAKTAMAWGSGGLHIAACRIGVTVETWPATRSYAPGQIQPGGKGSTQTTGSAPAGRWPANIILGHLPECIRTGNKKVGKGPAKEKVTRHRGGYGMNLAGSANAPDSYGEETVVTWRCAVGCPVAELDALSGDRPSTLTGRADPTMPHDHPASHEISPDRLARTRCNWGMLHAVGYVYADSGGASRFFKQVSWETK